MEKYILIILFLNGNIWWAKLNLMVGQAVPIQSSGLRIVMLQHEVTAVMDGVTEDVRISSQCLCIHITINKMLRCLLFLGYACHIHTVCQCACTVRSGSRR